MTTPNHSAVAAIVAMPTEHYSAPIKVAILVGLALSHVPADMLPHDHLYDFARLKQTWVGAMQELGIGLIVLPFMVLVLSHVSFWWLVECIVAASLIDFLVALKVSPIVKLNRWAHRWEHDGEMSIWRKIRWEFPQSLVLMITLFAMMFWQNLQR